jgi:uncharacterized membrane protein YgdD (TMEM256/DUF423 family)
MNLHSYRVIAALSGFSTVALGAFAAHGLKPYLSEYATSIWHTAVFYQFVHTLLLVAVLYNVHLCENQPKQVKRLSGVLITGMALFSGSLYTIALTGIGKLGMITPIGGTLLLMSWLYLIVISKGLVNKG